MEEEAGVDESSLLFYIGSQVCFFLPSIPNPRGGGDIICSLPSFGGRTDCGRRKRKEKEKGYNR